MRNYIQSFMELCEYPTEARLTLTDAYDALLRCNESAEFIKSVLREYDESTECDYKRYIDYCSTLEERHSVSRYTYELLLFILLTKRLKERYDESRLSPDMYRGAVLDLKWKMLECYGVMGVWGSFVSHWFVDWFRLKRFSLGRLQYEYAKFGREYAKKGVILHPDDKVLFVHIPRSLQPLTPELVEDSLARAKEFYKADHLGKPFVVACSSWMLYPGNLEFIHPLSNTAKFAARFEILASSADKDGAYPNAWRVFNQGFDGDTSRINATTSIAKALLRHYENGGRMGTGYGIMIL